MIVIFKNKKMNIFSIKKMKVMKTNIYLLNNIKTQMINKINKKTFKMIKNIIQILFKKNLLTKSLLKDNGKQKNLKEVKEVYINMKLDFNPKKEKKIENKNGHFFIKRLKNCKKKVILVL